MASLPEWLVAANRLGSLEALPGRSLATTVLGLLRAELEQHGPDSALVAPLSEALRVCLAREPAVARALRLRHVKLGDARVWKTVALMQRELAKSWTVEKLAKACGMSRAVFARQFALATGVSPLRYLTRCRMELAAAILADSDGALAEIAIRVGYESEYAFNRAFKRHHHVSPGVFRRELRSGGAVALRLAA